MTESKTIAYDSGNPAPVLRKTAGRPTRAATDRIRRVNIAMWRLVHGKGNLCHEIGIIAGISADSARNRVWDAENSYSPQELECSEGKLSPAELKYLERRFGRSDDPSVRQFLATNRNLDRVRRGNAEPEPSTGTADRPDRAKPDPLGGRISAFRQRTIFADFEADEPADAPRN